MSDTTLPFQRIEQVPMREATFKAVRNNVIRFRAAGQPPTDEPSGITACYERLSQEDRGDGESNSIANQKKILERYCKTHGFMPYQHYDKDDGYSGTSWDRPGFQKMLSDIKAGRVSRVVVKDMSRLGRDYLQVGMYTDVVFPEYGVHFVAVTDGVDSTKGDSEFTAIRNVFNEMYARDTSKKIRATAQHKGKSGEHLSSHPPFGYTKDPDNPKRWVIDEGAAAIVQKVFSLCADGLGVTAIARWLYDNGVPTPSEYRAKSGDGHTAVTSEPCGWAPAVVSQMLGRMEYLGHTVNFKTYSKSYKSKRRIANDPDNWAVFENTHEPIIEESVFAVVQNIRINRKRPTRGGKPDEYAGLLFCMGCKAKMYLNRRPGSGAYERYVCSAHRNKPYGCECAGNTISKRIVNRVVLANLREAIAYVKDDEAAFIREAEQTAMCEQDRELAVKKDTLARSERRVTELDNIIMRLYEDNINGKLTDERFIKMSCDYEREQDNLKAMCEELCEDVKQQEKTRYNTKSFIAEAKKYTDIQELDATILREFIERIEISHKDKATKTRQVRIVYNFIGAFDFNHAASRTASRIEPVHTGKRQRKAANG
jgi:DNA invertase Pin-like site-specific DNA recombinase